MAKAVFCITHTETQAIAIVDQLRAAGFSRNDISVLFPDKTGTKDFAHEQHTPRTRARGRAFWRFGVLFVRKIPCAGFVRTQDRDIVIGKTCCPQPFYHSDGLCFATCDTKNSLCHTVLLMCDRLPPDYL
jgi:hypothetical protein